MASQIKVDQITDKLGTGTPSFPHGIDAADLTGTLPALDGSALTGLSGGWEELQSTTITSDLSFIDYDFPAGYSRFRLEFDGLRSAVYGAIGRLRLKNSSGSLIDSSGSYVWSFSSNNSAYAYDYVDMQTFAGPDVATGKGTYLHVEFYNPRVTNRTTFINFNALSQYGGNRHYFGSAFSTAEEEHSAFRFYFHDGSNLVDIDANSYGYKIWGHP